VILSNAEICALYHGGLSCQEISKTAQCSETTVYNILTLLGVKIRSRSEANKSFPDRVFVVLYNLGLSSSQIGQILGLDGSTVTKRLQSLDFPLRARGVAARIRYTNDEFRQYFLQPEIIDRLNSLICDTGER